MYKSVKDEDFFKCSAEELAQNLLGKVICYSGIRYMITVTEAYPYNEQPDNKGKQISYVNRSQKGKGHDVLTDCDKIGNCFVYGGMLHIACKGGENCWKGEYSCGNVLIRGGILVNDSGYCKEDIKLNYETGKPYTLCRTKMQIPKDFNDKADRIIFDFKSFNDTSVQQKERINIASDKKYRFYLDLNELKGNN